MCGLWRWGVLLALGLALSGCAGKVEKVAAPGRCMSFADALATLQIGDELPRVRQVLGVPSRAYRARSSLGLRDVLEYNVGQGPCAPQLLGGSRNGDVQVVFDRDGRFEGFGRRGFFRMIQASTGRETRLPYDATSVGIP